MNFTALVELNGHRAMFATLFAASAGRSRSSARQSANRRRSIRESECCACQRCPPKESLPPVRLNCYQMPDRLADHLKVANDSVDRPFVRLELIEREVLNVTL